MSKRNEERPIRCFGPDGANRRRYSVESAEYLVSRKSVVAVRHKGAIVSIHFYGESRMPIQSRLKAGTRYSYKEQVGDRHRWTHARLPSIPVLEGLSCGEFASELERLRSEVFYAVALSVTRPASPCAARITDVT